MLLVPEIGKILIRYMLNIPALTHTHTNTDTPAYACVGTHSSKDFRKSTVKYTRIILVFVVGKC